MQEILTKQAKKAGSSSLEFTVQGFVADMHKIMNLSMHCTYIYKKEEEKKIEICGRSKQADMARRLKHVNVDWSKKAEKSLYMS